MIKKKNNQPKQKKISTSKQSFQKNEFAEKILSNEQTKEQGKKLNLKINKTAVNVKNHLDKIKLKQEKEEEKRDKLIEKEKLEKLQQEEGQLDNSLTLQREKIFKRRFSDDIEEEEREKRLKTQEQEAETELQQTVPLGLMEKRLLEKRKIAETIENQVTNLKQSLLTKMKDNQEKMQKDTQILEEYFNEKNEEEQKLQKPGSSYEKNPLDDLPISIIQGKGQSFLSQQESRKYSLTSKVGGDQASRRGSKESRRSSKRDSLLSKRDSMFFDNKSVLSMSRRRSTQNLTKEQVAMIKEKQKQEQQRIINEIQQKKLGKLKSVVRVQACYRGFVQRKKFREMKERFHNMQKLNIAEQEMAQFENECINTFFSDKDKLFMSEKYDVEQKQEKREQLKTLQKNIFFPTMFNLLSEEGNLEFFKNEQLMEGEMQMKQKLKKEKMKNERDEKKEEIRNYLMAQNLKLQRQKFKPKTVEIISKVPENNIVEEKGGVLSLFLKQNQNLPQIFKNKDFGEFIEDFDSNFQTQISIIKIQTNYREQEEEEKQDNNQDQNHLQSVSYSDNFEQESLDDFKKLHTIQNIKPAGTNQFQKNQENIVNNNNNNNNNKNNQNNKPSFKDSIKDTIISEEDYLKESFERQSDIQSEINKKQNNNNNQNIDPKTFDSRISESINIDEDLMQSKSKENLERQQQIDDDRIQTFKNENINNNNNKINNKYVESIDNYNDEKFESFSEDQHSLRDPLSQDRQLDLKQNQNLIKNNIQIQNNEKNDIKGRNLSLINQELSKNSEILQQPKQHQQKEQNKETIRVNILPEIYSVIQKYKPQQNEKQSSIIQQFSREQKSIEVVEIEIRQLIENTQKITNELLQQKNENNLRDSIYINSDKLYNKFEFEFNKLISNNTFSKKLSLLNNNWLFQDNSQNASNLEDSNHQQQKQNSQNNINEEQQDELEVYREQVEKIENKQNLLQKVLAEVLKNLQKIRQQSIVFKDLQKMQEKYDQNLKILLKKQETVIKTQFQETINERDNEIQNMVKFILNNQNKELEQQQKYFGKNLVQNQDNSDQFQALIDQNRDSTQTNQKNKNYFKDIYDQFDENQRQEFQKQNLKQKQNFFKKDEDNQFIQYEQDQISMKDLKKLKERINKGEEVSYDLEADSSSNVSWQEINLIKNISKQELNQINDTNNEKIVQFLSEMLLAEIANDLFPQRNINYSLNK